MTLSSSMIQSLQVINARVTFRNAPIHLLEKFAFIDIDYAYKKILENCNIRECVIVQTCNRVEVFAAGTGPYEKKLLEVWGSIVGLPVDEIKNTAEISKDRDVVLHLLKLASGLDSLVIGEDQILGQVKRAFDFANKKHYAGSNLLVMFDRAVKVGSKVRTSTSLNKGSISIGSIAVNLAEEYFENLKSKGIILIGTGEGASLVAKSLKQRDINFLVTSRTFQRAKSFADTVGGEPTPFEKALEILHEIDLIFVSTTAPYYLVTYDRIEKAMSKRENGMMILDLSNPRTVEERVASVSKVKLINMDQIAEIVEKNTRSRKNEIGSAERLIDIEMNSMHTMYKRKKADPIVDSVFKNVDTIRDRELKKAFSILGKKIGPEESKIIEKLSYAIVEGILSSPMNNLRKEMEKYNEKEDDFMKLIIKLFSYENK
ncbi:MAG: hemA [Nitrososphaeraceae archaeon]|jgi:glutamyl-tRNA reductase|nr:hemA [Nitrososphaeraceae archaeon]MDF2767348.1 hemA [Nitrososphaeraceae archaeon]